jgi:hypothetical protein
MTVSSAMFELLSKYADRARSLSPYEVLGRQATTEELSTVSQCVAGRMMELAEGTLDKFGGHRYRLTALGYQSCGKSAPRPNMAQVNLTGRK